MMSLSMSDIGYYLDASRAYIENAKSKFAQIGFCCDPILSNLIEDQDLLDRAYYQEMQRSNNLGLAPIVWLISAGTTIAISLGSYIYTHYTKAKIQSDRLDCLAKYEEIYKSLGPVGASNKALAMCDGQVGESTKEEIIQTIKLAIYGGVAIFGLYILNKFIKNK